MTVQLVSLLEPIRVDLEQVTSVLHERLARIEGALGAALRESVGGGKCIRSALVISVGRMFSTSAQLSHKLAAAVELLHAATLIHDDLVDGAALRRGREAFHTAWPAGVTILAGDALLAQTAGLVAELGRPRILSVFAEALCTMSIGEIQQVMTIGRDCCSRAAYYQRIEAKTASLCAAATEMAGVLARAEEEQVVALRRYGRELGLAFQIVDDVLDFVGDEAQLGKPAGSDLRQGLVTLPVICYLERVTNDGAVRAVLAGQRDEADVQTAVEAVCGSGAVEAAIAEAHAHVDLAREALGGLPDGLPRQCLDGLAQYVVQRQR